MGKQAWRYWSVLESPAGLWVVAKTGKFPHAIKNAKTIAFVDCDAKLRTGNRSCLESPIVVVNDSRVAHNLGLAIEGDLVWGIGGETLVDDNITAETVRVFGSSNDVSLFRTEPGGVRAASPGCIERREKYAPLCQFDGRFSVCVRGEDRLLYARANTALAGGRHVSVARRLGRAEWSRFELLTFLNAGEDNAFARVFSNESLAREAGDIYVAAVNAIRGAFVGLFSATVQLPSSNPRASIFLAISCDGAHFSPPTPLVAAIAVGKGEILDHAADGLLLADDLVYFYVHHGVQGPLHRGTRRCPFAKEEARLHRLPSSMLVRYAFDRQKLLAEIRRRTLQLYAAGFCPNRRPSSS